MVPIATVGALLWTVGCALVQPIREPAAGPYFRQMARDMIAPLTAASRAFDAPHVQLAD